MNKVLAILFLLGAIAGFGLSQRSTYRVQDSTPRGAPVGEPRTVTVEHWDKLFFVAFGTASMAACLFFVAKMRREDLR